MIWIPLGHSHIYIVPWCCDGLTSWLILIERFYRWGWHTDDYGFILLMCLIKLLTVPFLGIGQARRSVPPLCFSHSYMRSMVAGRLGSLLLSTLLLVCICSIVRQKFLDGPPCIPWSCLIYPCSVGEPQDLSGPPYVRCLFMGCPLSSKIPRGLPRYPR